MSIESAKAFYQRMIEDEAFNTQYTNALSDEKREEMIASTGYSFTPEEWQVTLAEASSLSGEELSDAELTEVSGGIKIIPGLWPPSPTIPTSPFPGVRPIYGGPITWLD